MKIAIAATSDLLKEITGRQIMYFIQKYGVGAFIRKKMIIIEGVHYILATPEEIESGELSRKIMIGWCEL